jgi:hypothetical protein
MRQRLLNFLLPFLFSFFLMFTFKITAAPGDFDRTFGTNSQVINTIPNASAATSVAVQADGKIVFASESFSENSDAGEQVANFGTSGDLVVSAYYLPQFRIYLMPIRNRTDFFVIRKSVRFLISVKVEIPKSFAYPKPKPRLQT